ncbi:MAG: PAS domain S-box protein [Desulfurivibrio sp.]|nr:PAS domain S-box protein [Desulfurivibrio sp.]
MINLQTHKSKRCKITPTRIVTILTITVSLFWPVTPGQSALPAAAEIGCPSVEALLIGTIMLVLTLLSLGLALLLGRKNRRAQAANAERELLLTSIGEGVYGVDQNGNCTFFNRAAQEMLGFSAEELLGRDQHKLFHGRYPMDGSIYPYAECPIRLTLEDGHQRREEDEWFWRKDGSVFPVSLLVSPLIQEEKLVGAVVIFRDRSEAKELESQLFQARSLESIGVLAGGIAHDFNNILTPIIMRSEMSLALLPPNSPPDSPLCHNLEQIRLAAERAKTMVGQILAFSRQGEHNPRQLALEELVKETLKFIRTTLPANIELEFVGENGQDLVNADPTRITQVIMNLVTNAAYAMRRQGGKVTLSLRRWPQGKRPRHRPRPQPRPRSCPPACPPIKPICN